MVSPAPAAISSSDLKTILQGTQQPTALSAPRANNSWLYAPVHAFTTWEGKSIYEIGKAKNYGGIAITLAVFILGMTWQGKALSVTSTVILSALGLGVASYKESKASKFSSEVDRAVLDLKNSTENREFTDDVVQTLASGFLLGDERGLDLSDQLRAARKFYPLRYRTDELLLVAATRLGSGKASKEMSEEALRYQAKLLLNQAKPGITQKGWEEVLKGLISTRNIMELIPYFFNDENIDQVTDELEIKKEITDLLFALRTKINSIAAISPICQTNPGIRKQRIEELQILIQRCLTQKGLRLYVGGSGSEGVTGFTQEAHDKWYEGVEGVEKLDYHVMYERAFDLDYRQISS